MGDFPARTDFTGGLDLNLLESETSKISTILNLIWDVVLDGCIIYIPCCISKEKSTRTVGNYCKITVCSHGGAWNVTIPNFHWEVLPPVYNHIQSSTKRFLLNCSNGSQVPTLIHKGSWKLDSDWWGGLEPSLLKVELPEDHLPQAVADPLSAKDKKSAGGISGFHPVFWWKFSEWLNHCKWGGVGQKLVKLVRWQPNDKPQRIIYIRSKRKPKTIKNTWGMGGFARFTSQTHECWEPGNPNPSKTCVILWYEPGNRFMFWCWNLVDQ